MMFLGLNLMSHFNYENITTYTQRTATDLKVGHLISFTPIISTCSDDVRLHVSSLLNPSSPNSDQHQFSPNNIHTMSRD